ncbi:MAG TPA: hypothetical protein VEX41_05960 [Candidatus Eisenbacteria bacterium]|nr:hypothetical protein [Candidatus Eisenbacteria bacterium]
MRALRARGRGRLGLVILAAVVALLPGCTVDSSTPLPPAPGPTLEPPGTVGPPATSSSLGPGEAVVIDTALLAVLPAAVDGVPVTESTDGEADAIANPQLPGIASALAAGLAVDSASSNFVYAVVVRLLPGGFDDIRFRDWRDSYDEGACSGAGGVMGHAQAEIAGRAVFIGTCEAGVRTYHAWITDKDLLVSASAAGDRRLGERLMAGLRP